MRLRLVLLDRLYETVHDVASVDDRELRKEKTEFLFVCPAEPTFYVGRKIPEPFLERSERLLPGLIEELLVGVSRLALVLRVLPQPFVDLFAQSIRDVIEQHRLEVRREVYLRRLRARKIVERAIRKRGRTVLDRARQSILLPGDLGQSRQSVEVDLHIRDRAIGQHHSAVCRSGLHADLG